MSLKNILIQSNETKFRGITYVISAIIRPSQKEILDKSVDHNIFNDMGHYGWDESLECYLSDQFWKDFEELNVNPKSIYKISIKVSIIPMRYLTGYYGNEEYDEDYETEILWCIRATTFRELRDGLHHCGIIPMTPEYLERRYPPFIFK